MGLKVELNIRATHFMIIAVLASAFVLPLMSRLFIFTSPVYAEAAGKKTTIVSVSPQLSMPENNSIKNGGPLTYSWQPIEGADHYVYESYDDSELTVVHERQIVNDTKFERFEEHEAEIWWRIKAVFASGDESNWSEARRVIVDNVAPMIQNITEGDTSKVSGMAVFKVEVTDGYPDEIIASMDGVLMPTNQVVRESTKASILQARRVTVRITLNIDTLQLKDGAHSLTVRAIDHAENLSDPLAINFLVVNAPPVAEKEPEKPITKPIEAIQTIAMPEAPPIAPILGGEQIIAADPGLSDDSAVTHAEAETIAGTMPVNAHEHPIQRPHVNFGWPMWLSFGALLSGTGWWMFSGRKRP